MALCRFIKPKVRNKFKNLVCEGKIFNLASRQSGQMGWEKQPVIRRHRGGGGVSLMGENYLQGLLGSPLHLQGKVAQRGQLRGQLPFWDEQGGLLRCSGPRETLVHVCRGPSPPMGCCGVSSLISGSGLGSGKPGVSDFTLPDPNCKKFYFLNCKIRRFNEMNHFQLFLTMERTLLKQNLTHISSYWK